MGPRAPKKQNKIQLLKNITLLYTQIAKYILLYGGYGENNDNNHNKNSNNDENNNKKGRTIIIHNKNIVIFNATICQFWEVQWCLVWGIFLSIFFLIDIV